MRVLRNADDAMSFSLIESWSSRREHEDHLEAITTSGVWAHVKSHLAIAPVARYYAEA